MAQMIKLQPIEALVASPNNARTHSPDQIALLKSSMEQFGFVGAILADKAGIVAGHGRVDAARMIYADGGVLRYPDGSAIPVGKLPVQDCTGWTPDQRRAYMIADNQLAMLAGWDDEILRAEIEALIAADFDIELTGFDEAAIHDLLNLGGGRTEPDDVKAVLAGAKPHLMVTDPPYGVDYDPDWRTHSRNGDGSLLSSGSGRAKGVVENDDRADWS